MTIQRFVEIGRVVIVNRGPSEGKLAVIVDVIDQNRALIDGPATGVARQAFNFKHVSLTDFTVKVAHSAGTGAVLKSWNAADISNKWAATSWAKKLAARVQRAKLTDFERFVVKVTKQKRNKAIAAELKKLTAKK